MHPQRMIAYRHLLYHAMLDIRGLAWVGGWGHRLNPFGWWSRSRHVRRAGEIANWLHNLAKYSRFDFKGFNEDWFWRDYQRLVSKYPDTWLAEYRAEFESHTSPVQPVET